MTETVNVLPHLQELKTLWRQQDFRYTKDQREQYDMLIAARRERVKYFYEAGLVAKSGERLNKEQQEEEDS